MENHQRDDKPINKMIPAKGQGSDNTGESYSYSFGYSYYDPQRGYVMEYRGPFNGVGPNSFLRSDRRIREDLLVRLAQDRSLNSLDITVDVKGGEVLLQGAVEDRQAKDMAEQLAFSVPGVKCVHNELRIAPSQLEQARPAHE